MPPTSLSGPSLKTMSTLYSTPPLHKPQHSSTHFDINSQNTFAPPSTTSALTPYTNKQFSTAPTLQSTTSHSHHHHSSFTQTTDNGLPYDTPAISTATAYPVHSFVPLDFSQFHIGSSLPARSTPTPPTTPQGRFRFYAVRRGRQTGIFTSWPECRRQVNGISSEYRGFQSLESAQAYLRL